MISSPRRSNDIISSPNEELAGAIFPPPARSPEQQEAIDYMENVAFPRYQARNDHEERAYFGELEGERSQRTMRYSHHWLVTQGHEHAAEVAADAALLAASCGVPLMLSAEHPEIEPMLGPDCISFNGRGDAGEDFKYPSDPAARTKFAFLGTSGQCRSERRDYDVLVSAVLLSIKHHTSNDGVIRSNGAPDSVGWPPAFDLYARTFPDRDIPGLDNWPNRSQKAE